MVMQLPEGDQQSRSRRQLMAELDVCMGGRVAEELIFGSANITTGASSDLQKVGGCSPSILTLVLHLRLACILALSACRSTYICGCQSFSFACVSAMGSPGSRSRCPACDELYFCNFMHPSLECGVCEPALDQCCPLANAPLPRPGLCEFAGYHMA